MKKRQRALSTILKAGNFSDFEKAVYRAIAAIPRGEIRTYKWVAGRIGRPRAFRAVGNALNKNPYPVIVPCHRVIKSDGSLGGFSMGALKKRRLLESEGVDVGCGRCYNRV